MRIVIIILSVLPMTWPSKANACDPNCALFGAVILGAPTVLGSTIVFPLIGLAIDNGENPPYWRAVGYTFLASSAGVGLAAGLYDDSNSSAEGNLTKFVGIPFVFGAVATLLTYTNAPRGTDKTSSALWQYAPQVSVSPFARGGSIGLNWSF